MTADRIPHPRTPGRAAASTASALSAPSAQGASRRRRRWPPYLVMAVLVAVSAGYFVIAAEQSHDPSAAQQLRAEMAGLVMEWPSGVQEHVYKVPIPSGATGVGYFEQNSWHTDSLYVQFRTSAGGLDTFLAQLGISRANLERGHLTITSQQARRVGWTFVPGHDWDGVSLPAHAAGSPGYAITVNMDDPDAPLVYVVSTVSFS